MPDVQSTIHFLARDDLYKEEKPYSLRYPTEDELPQTNFRLEQHENITFHDLRGRESSFSYHQNGFTVMHLDSQMTYEDFGNQEKIKTVFIREVGEKLHNVLGASIVQALDHIVRKRHPEFPISTGQPYHYNQPTNMAHIDATPSCMVETIKNLNQEKASDYLKYRFECVNIWKPLRGPLRDWPLALCDATTVETEADLRPADIVYNDAVVENYQVHFTPKQRWYYLDNQLPSEVHIFRQTDSDIRPRSGVPHSSFPNPLSPASEPPRESIEARFAVYYKPHGL